MFQFAAAYHRGKVFLAKYTGRSKASVLRPVLASLDRQIRRAFGYNKEHTLTVQQDNCPVQNSTEIMNYWKDLGWKTIRIKLTPTRKGKPKFLPVTSPDLSPMDSVLFGLTRTILDKKLERRTPKTERGFDALVKRILTSKKCTEAVEKFVDDFGKRFRHVIDRGGEITL